MAQNYFSRLFESFNDKNILILGDVMIDSYLWGDVNRISPEAPVPILSGVGRENRLGGAANVALNIQALGAKPILCSVIGDDLRAADFVKLLHQQNLSTEGIVKCKERMTTVKTRVMSQNQHLLRVDEEICTPIDYLSEEKLMTKLMQVLQKNRIDAIVFEDYDKGVITPSVIQKVVVLAMEKSILTLVDPKKRNFNDYKNVSLFKPNFKEFNDGCKLELKKGQTQQLTEAAIEFQKKQNIDILMITLSEHGVFVKHKDGQPIIIPAEIRSISDVSGAGDTVIGVSALCLTSGMEPGLIARVANMAGGLVCEQSGVVPIKKELLLKECVQKISV